MTRFARGLIVGLSLVGVLVVSAVGAEDRPGLDAKAAFAKMKTLAGEWMGEVDGHGGHGPGKETFKLTGNGSTLMETQFPGSDHEMITMYHLDGDNLVATHYCAIGNQPRLKYDAKASKPDALVFAFDGGSNLDPAKDMHIHAATFTFVDEKHVKADWEGYAGGKSAGFTKIALSRK